VLQEGKSSKSAPMSGGGEVDVGGEVVVEVITEFPPSGALVRSGPGGGEPGVGGEVITEVPPAGALIRGEVPALPPPAAVEGGEVFPAPRSLPLFSEAQVFSFAVGIEF
jgi:hypothetical protein